MLKPLSTARVEGKFKSFDELAKRLVSSFPGLDWPASRALAVKIADIDRGDKVWWMRRHENALALADMLEVPLTDLGLLEVPMGEQFEFATFPELPPLALGRETGCELGFVDTNDGKPHEEKLQYWLDAVPPRFGWRGPEHRISWLEFQPGSGLSFYWATLRARSRHDILHIRRLADVGDRLRQPGNLIVRIGQPCDEIDLIAMASIHDDLNLLVVAPFGAPRKDPTAPTTWLPSWEVLTGLTDERVAALTDPDGFRDAIASHAWRLHDDWQARLLNWVEKRMSRATDDTLLTAKGVANWLTTFPDGWQFVKGPADLLAICRLCHASPETTLPPVSDSDAGQRLLKRITRTDNAIAQRFTALVTARLEARELDWNGPLSRDRWASLAPDKVDIPDEAALLAIANAGNQATRRQHAHDLLDRLHRTSLAPLVNARLLVETRTGELGLAPQFLVDLIARDQLMQRIRDDAVERWAMYCFDPGRRVLVDAALGSLSIAELLLVLDRIKALPSGTLAGTAVVEAMFREVGKRICGAATVPQAFACLAEMAVSRMDAEDLTPSPLTRYADEASSSPEWLGICWAWSLWCPPPPFGVPETWAWWFPGWARGLADAELPFLWTFELPEQHQTSSRWPQLMTLAARLVGRLDRPPTHAPSLLKPALLVEGIRGRWGIDPLWLGPIVGNQGEQASGPAEDLVLNELARIGPTAAVRLLPALMAYYLSDLNDRIRHILFHRSKVRTWTLRHVACTDVASSLTEVQKEALWQAPHTLPPHLLPEILLDPDAVDPANLPARIRAVRVLGADQVDTLSRLLGTTSLGMIAAERLWTLAPETAERLLNVLSQQHDTQALHWLVLLTPVDRTRAAARAILARDGSALNEWRDWARQRLPFAGADAELLGRILEIDVL